MSRNLAQPRDIDDAEPAIPAVVAPGNASPRTRVLKGRYRPLARLGSGRLGVAYDAVDQQDRVAGVERHVAILLLDANLMPNRRFTGEFERGVMSLRRISHPNIAGLLDSGCDDGHYFIVREHPESGSLRFVLDDAGKLPLEEATAVIRAVGDALRYLHAKAIVHGNVTPENVLVTFDYEVKLLDVVPPEWLPIAHGRPDQRDDVYGLACLAYEMLSGRHPFNANTAEEARRAGLQPAVLTDLQATQWQALAAALELNHEVRTPTIAQFLDGFGVTGDEKLRAMVVGDPAGAPETGLETVAAPARASGSLQTGAEAPLSARVVPRGSPRSGMPGRLLVLLLLAALGAVAYDNRDRLREEVVAALESIDGAIQGDARLDPAPPVKAAAPQPAPSIAAPADPPAPVAAPVEIAVVAAVPAGSTQSGPARFSLGQAVLTVSENEIAARIVIRRSGGLTRPASIAWWTREGSAIADRDFVDLGRRVERFQAGEERRTVFVPLANDADPEPVRSFNVYLGDVTDSGASEPLSGMRVDIIDDD